MRQSLIDYNYCDHMCTYDANKARTDGLIRLCRLRTKCRVRAAGRDTACAWHAWSDAKRYDVMRYDVIRERTVFIHSSGDPQFWSPTVMTLVVKSQGIRLPTIIPI